MRQKAEQGDLKLTVTHYSKNYMEIYALYMNNSDILGLAGEMRDSVIFLVTVANSSFDSVGRKKKQEHEKAKEDLQLIYFKNYFPWK